MILQSDRHVLWDLYLVGGLEPWNFTTSIAMLNYQRLCLLVYKATGWWFQTFFIFHDIWDNPNPIDELHHFSRWLLHHQPDMLLGISWDLPSGYLT